MLSGVVVPIYLISSYVNDEEQLVKILTNVMRAAMSCKPAVDPLVHQYKQTSVQRERSHLKHCIQKVHRTALRGSCPTRLLSRCVKLVTHLARCDIDLDYAAVGRNIIVYCRVKTVEALSDLQQMIDSGRLNQLFSGIFTAFANTGLLSRLFSSICSPFASPAVIVFLSTEEYQRTWSLLTSDGKLSLIIV